MLIYNYTSVAHQQDTMDVSPRSYYTIQLYIQAFYTPVYTGCRHSYQDAFDVYVLTVWVLNYYRQL